MDKANNYLMLPPRPILRLAWLTRKRLNSVGLLAIVAIGTAVAISSIEITIGKFPSFYDGNFLLVLCKLALPFLLVILVIHPFFPSYVRRSQQMEELTRIGIH